MSTPIPETKLPQVLTKETALIKLQGFLEELLKLVGKPDTNVFLVKSEIDEILTNLKSGDPKVVAAALASADKLTLEDCITRSSKVNDRPEHRFKGGGNYGSLVNAKGFVTGALIGKEVK